MSEYRIFETDAFQQRLRRVALRQQTVIARKLAGYVYPQLRTAPFYGPNIRKLRGFDSGVWRYRIGNYRMFYSVDEEKRIVFMLTIDDRKDAYR